MSRRQSTGNLNASEMLVRLLHAVSWGLAAALISRILMLAGSVYIARAISKADFGEYSYVLSSAYLMAGFGAYGLNIIATKFVAERTRSGDELKVFVQILQWLALVLAILSAFAFILLRKPLSAQVPNPIHAGDLIVFGSVLVLGLTLSSIQLAMLYGLERFRQAAIAGLFQAVICVVLQVLSVRNFGVQGAIVALGLSQALLCVCLQFVLVNTLPAGVSAPVSLDVRLRLIGLVLKQATPVFLSGVVVMPVSWLQNVLMLSGSAGLVGVAAVGLAGQWKMAVLFVPGVMASVISPKMVSYFQSGDYRSFKHYLLLNFIICSAICAALVVIAFFASAEVGRIYGNAYSADRWIFFFFTVNAALMAINGVIGQVILSVGKLWLGLMFNLAWAIATIAFTYYFLVVTPQGAVGVAYANIAAYLLHCVWQFIFIMTFIKRHQGNG